MFRGDDWCGCEMYNEIEIKFKTVGCDMVFLSNTEGISFTQLTKTLHDIMENDV